MKFKYNGIETDGNGNSKLHIPAVINDMIKVNAGDVIEANGVSWTFPVSGVYSFKVESLASMLEAMVKDSESNFG